MSDSRDMSAKYQPLEDSADVRGGDRRLPDHGVVERSGATTLGAEASEQTCAQARAAGHDPRTFGIRFVVNEADQRVLVYTEDAKTPKVQLPKIYDDGRAVRFHLRPVFRKHPLLRPTTAIDVTVKPDKDPDGKDCMVINLKSAKEHKAIKRGPRGPRKKKVTTASL